MKNLITIYTMNLSGRIHSIINNLKPGFILMIPVFLGCEASDDIGIPFELESSANVRFIELELPATTVFIDSLRTDSENRILVGQFQDELTGLIKTESYFSMKYASNNAPNGEIGDNFVYDSVRMSLLSPTSIGNNSLTQSFSISLLPDTISNVVYLSSSKQQSIGDQVGSFETQVGSDTNYFNFQLDDTFGNQLFRNVTNFDPLLGSTDWPSLAIIPNANSEVINQIKLNADTSRIFLYVTDPGGATKFTIIGGDTLYNDTTYTVEFRFDLFTSENPHYVNIDRSGVNTTLPGDINVIDVLAGVTTSISTEPLEEFINERIDEGQSVIFNNATLAFSFEEESGRDTLENFYAFFYRNENYFASALVTSPFNNLIMSDNAFLQSSNSPALSSLNIDRDEIVISATLFFQSMHNEYVNNTESSSLLVRDSTGVSLVDFIMLSQSDVTLQRAIFNGVKLRIYYTEVN